MGYSHFSGVAYSDKFAKGQQGAEVEIKPVSGVADGYKIARGETSVTGTADIATGLATVVSAIAVLKDDVALTAIGVSITDSATAGNIILKVWKPTLASDCTPIVATVAKTIKWLAIGT